MTERLSDEDCRIVAENAARASAGDVRALAREVLELRRVLRKVASGDHSDNDGIPNVVLDLGDLRPAPPALGGEG